MIRVCILALVVSGVPALLAARCIAGGGPTPHPAASILRSASELDYPPFSLVREDGSADGFSVDLLKAVCRAVGLEIRFKVGPWHEIKQELVEGRLDVLPLVSYSTARDRHFDFTTPYLRLHGAIFVRRGNTEIRSESDLKGREVLVMRGDTAHEYAQSRQLTDRLVLTDSYAVAMRRLAAGEHDAVIVQHLVGLQLIKRLNLSNLVSVQSYEDYDLKPAIRPLSGFEQKFCIAVREGDKQLLSRLNEGLSLVIASGVYDTLYDRWFGPLLPTPAVDAKTIATYLASILLPILILLGIVGIWYLRREVARQTKTLAASERRLSLAISATADAIWEWNLHTQRTYYSPRWYEMLGYPDRAFDMNVDTWKRLCHPDDLQPTLDRIQGRLAADDNEGYAVEFRMRNKDGAWLWILSRGNVVERDPSGKPVLLSGTNTDITVSKRQEAALRQLSQFPEQNPNPVLRMASDGTLLYVNGAGDRLLKTFDWQPGEPVPHVLSDAGRQACSQAGAVNVDIPVPGGLTFNVFATQPTGEDYVNFYGMDITERKRAESERFESDQRFRLALRNAPVSVTAQDRDLRYIWAYNPPTARPDEIIGCLDSDIFSADEAEAIVADKRRVMTENIELRRQMWLDHPDGPFFHDVCWEPIHDKRGRVTGVATAAVDLTPIKRAEERLKAALDEKEILLKEVHHRVKNNMQVLCSLVDLQAAEITDAAARDALQEVTHRVRSMAMVHEQLYHSIDVANIAFDEYIRSLSGYLLRSHTTSGKAIDLSLQLDPVTIPVTAAVPCGLILNELISNALKHAFPNNGGGTVAVRLEETDAAGISLCVRDNGRGMATDVDWRQSTRLGLRLVRMLTRQLHADMAVRVLGGTEFILTFNRANP